MQDAPEDEPPLPPSLRLLRALVFALTIVMILGFVVLISAFVIRLNASPLTLPDSIILPDGAQAIAFTQGESWFAVVTDDNRILIYDRADGQLQQTVVIE